MKIQSYKQQFVSGLSEQYGADEAESFFWMMLENYRNLKRIDLALDHKLGFTEIEISKWNSALEKLKRFVPIQYILGQADFCGLKFEVNENVLIPRPETEELVEWIVADCNGKNGLRILDVGTGSGCIAISLAQKLPGAHVSAIDVSDMAIETAKRNALQNNAAVNFIIQDIFECGKLEHFDIIVSNPPYVREMEKSEIRPNVLEHEPHLALFVTDTDALIFYQKIAMLALESLNPGGALYFEINQYLAKETMDLLESSGFVSLELRKDIFGNHRMIRAFR